LNSFQDGENFNYQRRNIITRCKNKYYQNTAIWWERMSSFEELITGSKKWRGEKPNNRGC
jgi:hypothetical protein